MAAQNQIPCPSDLSDWTRQKDDVSKKRMKMGEHELRTLRTAVRTITSARFDPMKTVRRQPPRATDATRSEACKVHGPFLRDCEGAWPVDALVLAHIENRRIHAKRKARSTIRRRKSFEVVSCARHSELQTSDPSTQVDSHAPPLLADDKATEHPVHSQSRAIPVVDIHQMMGSSEATSGKLLNHNPAPLVASIALGSLAVTIRHILPPESPDAAPNSTSPSHTTLNPVDPLFSETLVTASASGYLSIVQAIVQSGAELSASEHGLMALQEAVSGEHWNVAVYLLQNGVAPSPDHLVAAASGGSLDTVRVIIKMGVDVNAPDECTITALQGAIWEEHWDIAIFLLRHKATFSAYEFVGAARHGAHDVVRAMVKAGADVNDFDSQGDTALRVAVCNGHADTVRRLLHHGALCSNDDLMRAAASGFYDVVRAIVDGGVDVGTSDRLGRSPLTISAHNGHWRVANLLLEHGARYSVNDVIDASRKGALNVVRHIVDSDPTLDLDAVGKRGYTSLTAALEQGRRDVVEFLLGRGVRCGSPDVLVFASGAGFLDVVCRALQSSGTDVNARASNDVTAFQAALASQRSNIADFLLQHGAACGPDELVIACQAGALSSVTEIVGRGVDVNSPGRPRPLDFYKIRPLTAARMYPDVVMFLLEHGATCTSDDLIFACKRGHLRVVQEVIARGVNVNAFGLFAGEGLLPLDAARNHPRITQYLLQCGAQPMTNLSQHHRFAP